jgi:hypothetical protein
VEECEEGAQYVTIDDTLKTSPELRCRRPAVGITPKLSDAELLTVPIECGRSRETVNRSAAGWAAYGYCRSHARYFWGLRLHLVCTVHGLPVAFALANPKADERELLVSSFDVKPSLLAESVSDMLKGQLDLERHGGRTIEGVTVRVLQRLLALTAAIWHNHSTGQPVMRSLIADDHYCWSLGLTRPEEATGATRPGRGRSPGGWVGGRRPGAGRPGPR